MPGVPAPPATDDAHHPLPPSPLYLGHQRPDMVDTYSTNLFDFNPDTVDTYHSCRAATEMLLLHSCSSVALILRIASLARRVP